MVLLIGSVSGVAAADLDVELLPEKLSGATEEFLRADTAKARAMMPAFSDEDLQKIANAFKKSHTNSEQRIFWLIEDFYRRNSERVAAERIRYLYLAVLMALGFIGLFSLLTYRQAKNKQ